MRVRRAVLLTHRWLGLASSGVLAIMGVTGALLMLGDALPLQRVVGAIHQRLALGRFGEVIAFTTLVAALLLQAGGVLLWWKRKTLRVRVSRGIVPMLEDLHHATGTLLLPVMFVMVVTALAMRFVPFSHPWSPLIGSWHTGGDFPLPAKVIYAAATLGFALQGVTGVVMWWKPMR